jgi:hypothetical protein
MSYEHAFFRATQKSPHSDSGRNAIRFSPAYVLVEFTSSAHFDFSVGSQPLQWKSDLYAQCNRNDETMLVG